MHRYFVYILSNDVGDVLYTGVTNDLVTRVAQHRSGAVPGFTSRRDVYRVVYFEEHGYIKNAISREKQIKAGSRADKVKLIESINPTWRDFSDDW